MTEAEREGPALTDENGDLSTPYIGCRGCMWLRVNDFHYFYCRDLGNKNLPDFDAYNGGGMVLLRSYPRAPRDCRFYPKEHP